MVAGTVDPVIEPVEHPLDIGPVPARQAPAVLAELALLARLDGAQPLPQLARFVAVEPALLLALADFVADVLLCAAELTIALEAVAGPGAVAAAVVGVAVAVAAVSVG